MWHVHPINDEKPHNLEGPTCPCNPRVEYINPEDGLPYVDGPIVIHNSWDCREVVEEAEKILGITPSSVRSWRVEG